MKPTTEKPQDTVSGSVNETNKPNYSKQLRTTEPLFPIPFFLQQIDGKFFLTVGKYRASPEYENREDAIKDAQTIDWNKINLFVGAITEHWKDNLQNQIQQIKQAIGELGYKTITGKELPKNPNDHWETQETID